MSNSFGRDDGDCGVQDAGDTGGRLEREERGRERGRERKQKNHWELFVEESQMKADRHVQVL